MCISCTKYLELLVVRITADRAVERISVSQVSALHTCERVYERARM